MASRFTVLTSGCNFFQPLSGRVVGNRQLKDFFQIKSKNIDPDKKLLQKLNEKEKKQQLNTLSVTKNKNKKKKIKSSEIT